MEQALKLQKVYSQQLFENSHQGIAFVDSNDQIVDVNQAFEKLFQYSVDEIRGKQINDIIVPEEVSEETASLAKVVLTGEVAPKGSVS